MHAKSLVENKTLRDMHIRHVECMNKMLWMYYYPALVLATYKFKDIKREISYKQ